MPLLLTVPGIAWVLAFTIAAEIGDIERFATAKKLVGYTGLPAAGELTTSSPPVVIQIASQQPGGERLASRSIHREGAMHAA